MVWRLQKSLNYLRFVLVNESELLTIIRSYEFLSITLPLLITLDVRLWCFSVFWVDQNLLDELRYYRASDSSLTKRLFAKHSLFGGWRAWRRVEVSSVMVGITLKGLFFLSGFFGNELVDLVLLFLFCSFVTVPLCNDLFPDRFSLLLLSGSLLLNLFLCLFLPLHLNNLLLLPLFLLLLQLLHHLLLLSLINPLLIFIIQHLLLPLMHL